MMHLLRPVAVVLGVLMAAGCSTIEHERPAVAYYPIDDVTRDAIRAGGAPVPFSAAVRAGDLIFLSGRIPRTRGGPLPVGIEAQTRQVMENIGDVLRQSGVGFSDVVRCVAMLENMTDLPAFNRIYASYFPADRLPARSAFGADGLALGALIELECTAVAPSRRSRRSTPRRRW